MNKKFLNHLASIWLLAAMTGHSIAQTTVTLYPDKDAAITSLYPTLNYETYPNMRCLIGTYSGVPFVVRSLIEFDLSTIPSDAVIASADLYLYADDHLFYDKSTESYLQRLDAAWTESTVTWNNQPAVSATKGSVTLASATSSTQNYVVDMKAQVQDMILDPANNFGFLFRLSVSESNPYARLQFASSDHATSAKHPKLEISYWLPFVIDETVTHVDLVAQTYGSIEIDITDGTPPYTYEWSNGESTSTIENLEVGDYTVTVTDANNVIVSKTISVTAVAEWSEVYGATESDGELTKTAADGWGNAGAYSTSILDANSNGSVKYVKQTSDNQFRFGLNGYAALDPANPCSTLTSAGSAYAFELNTPTTFKQIRKMVASDRDVNDGFGVGVSVDGDYAIVGASIEDDDENGNNPLADAGSAYIWKKNASGYWVEHQKIVASDRAAGDRFGIAVNIYGDYAIVGAHINEAAYIFQRNPSTNEWTEIVKLTPSSGTGRFGVDVAIYVDYAIVGCYTAGGKGSAYIYERSGSVWSEVDKVVASDGVIGDQFGFKVDITDGYAIVGAYTDDEPTIPNCGGAYIYERDGMGSWQNETKLLASDRDTNDFYGLSVSITAGDSGIYALVGAIGEDHDAAGMNFVSDAGSAYVYKKTGGSWGSEAKLTAINRATSHNFGHVMDIGQNYGVIGAPCDGCYSPAFAIKRTGTTWAIIQEFRGDDIVNGDRFAHSVAINDTEDEIFAGAIYEDQDECDTNRVKQDYAFYIDVSNDLYIYENDESTGSYGSVTTGDVLTIQRSGTDVIYKKNDAILRTVATDAARQLRAEMLIYKNAVTTGEVFVTYNRSWSEKFAALVKELDGGFYYANSRKLKFKYQERYSGDYLKYKIYDGFHNVVMDETDQAVPKMHGPNWVTLNLDNISGILSNQYYVLEVFDENGRSSFLRFLMANEKTDNVDSAVDTRINHLEVFPE